MLKSGNVALTPLTIADATQLYEWINDREQVLFNAPYKPVSEPQHLEWLEAITSRPDAVIFGIRDTISDSLIGSCQLHSITSVHRSAELQIRIGNPSARGKGYGKSAVHSLLLFGFSDLNLHRVFVHVFATNEPAIHLYQSAGFTKEGVLRSAAFIDGKYVDVLVMGILEHEFRG
jgi:RimJ/RimL family protein N-acetyltransferase